MARFKIRNLGDDLMRHLCVEAAGHGHSMDEEARTILRTALNEHGPPDNLSRAIRARFAPPGGVKLEIPPCDPMREPPESTVSEAP